MKRGGSFGNIVASADMIVSANSLSSMRSHALKMKTPPGLSTRRVSANALPLSGKNITPNWHTTASNDASAKGSCIASAWRHSTARFVPTRAAWSSMAWFKSVATIETLSGSAAATARVTTPVPAAISSTRETGIAFRRLARSAA
jgi:hypothetical protein